MTTFKLWKHPKTGESRIYINGLVGQNGAKVWVERYPCGLVNMQVKVYADWNMSKAPLKDAAYDAIEDIIGRSGKFADLEKVAT